MPGQWVPQAFPSTFGFFRMETRHQLTLFLTENQETIERIRARFNPAQFRLIPAHVTLCREEELQDLDKVRANLAAIKLATPLQVNLGQILRTADGKGAFLPSAGENRQFHAVRKAVLTGVVEHPRDHQPHVTLMHPRNSACTDEIFAQLMQHKFPAQLKFRTISLIEQKAGGKWNILQEFRIAE
ncbi:2'-5' RNA ligase family protein [Sabulibacter ruber]|uniref:2'-5' RNA ligase family protein n=1 Tax=Sabulibacter ruber TaxID=2811901 RepID=UPI001A97A00B|nr:2'-5' RNA ligase family protein [Sabulibacter ruber]